jgi:hypothetical protein
VTDTGIRTVFIVNVPLRKDDVTGEYTEFLPMESAHSFGRVVELTPKGTPRGSIAEALRSIRDGLECWRDGDFIVLVGDQALLAYAAAIVGAKLAKTRGSLRFLKWDRGLRTYAPLFMRENITEGEGR